MRATLTLSIFLLFVSSVAAQTYGGPYAELVSSYRSVIEVPPASIVVPTVVEVPLLAQNERKSFLVVENGSEDIAPSYFNERYAIRPIGHSADVVINGQPASFRSLFDGSSETGLSFLLPEDRRGDATIVITGDRPITASSIHFDFARNVLMATTIEIRAVVDGQERIVLSEVPLTSESVGFIPTTATSWSVRLRYAQPLDIKEVTLVQDNAEKTVTRGIRFLAQPGRSYRIYHDADRTVQIPYRELGNLMNDQGVLTLGGFTTQVNKWFVPADSDRDDVADSFDNCVLVSNPDQMDIDRSGVGDVCEDFDRDGVLNSNDNCSNIANQGQTDEDGDGIGDACDEEESRFTERLPWVPWVGMGTAAVVLVGLFALVMNDVRRNSRSE